MFLNSPRQKICPQFYISIEFCFLFSPNILSTVLVIHFFLNFPHQVLLSTALVIRSCFLNFPEKGKGEEKKKEEEQDKDKEKEKEKGKRKRKEEKPASEKREKGRGKGRAQGKGRGKETAYFLGEGQ